MMEELKNEGWVFGKICVICHTEKISPKQEKLIFGLFSRNSFMCEQCGANFREGRGKWKLFDIKDKNNSIWQRYGQQAFLAREWENIGNGKLSDEDQRVADWRRCQEQRIADEARRASEIKSWMEKIKSGALKVKVIRVEVPIILQKDEEALCVLPNISLLETRAVSISRGGYGGASFRVAKGVSVRLGQFGARSESHPEMRNIDQGTLVVTNKRFIYCGRIKTVQTDLNKIVEIDPFDDGIGLHKENREKTQYFTWTNMDSLWRVCSTGSESLAKKELSRINEMGLDKSGEVELDDQGRKGSIPLTGEILKSIIEGAVKSA